MEEETRVWVTIDWDKVPAGIQEGSIKIAGAGTDEIIKLTARKPSDLTRSTLTGFAEGAGYVAIDAGHFTSKTDAGQAVFRPVEQYGMRTDAPSTSRASPPVRTWTTASTSTRPERQLPA